MKNKKKSIAVRKEFWDDFKETIEGEGGIESFDRCESFYKGYLIGLFRGEAITQTQRDEMRETLNTAIEYAKSKVK